MHALKTEGVGLNRKMLSQLVILDPTSFTQLTQKARAK
jgi:ribosomal protein L20